ncbi:hypothetical protein N7528_008379 [Penicillium herquei]|nr:hypothetical protein N7528_008379 [Penicillium herquei]
MSSDASTVSPLSSLRSTPSHPFSPGEGVDQTAQPSTGIDAGTQSLVITLHPPRRPKSAMQTMTGVQIPFHPAHRIASVEPVASNHGATRQVARQAKRRCSRCRKRKRLREFLKWREGKELQKLKTCNRCRGLPGEQ